MQPKNNAGTFILDAEEITIIEDWGVRNVSLLLVSGTVTVKGTMKLGTRDDDAITLGSTPLNITFDFAIDGLVINAMGGVALLVTGK